MAEKTVSKHLLNLEKQFAATDPVLQKAVKVFQELDQLEQDLDLLDNEETTARKTSWWPIVSTLGGYSPAKSEFINRYIGLDIPGARHKFTVLHYTPQAAAAVLPGAALDADHRLPFYRIGRVLDSVANGESARLNAYLELITVPSAAIKNKLVIDTPVLNQATETLASSRLRKYVIGISDLVLVFTDLFEADANLTAEIIADIVAQQDSNKFLFVIDHSEISLDTQKSNDIAAAWQRRLTEFGIRTGQFVVLSHNSGGLAAIEQRLVNIHNNRSYRILSTLEQSIRDVDDVMFAEVEEALIIWKERSNASMLIILGFLIMLLLFAEIASGVLDVLFDPIIGPAAVAVTLLLLTPVHLMISRFHAKLIIKQLIKRQNQLNLPENLAGLFEKSLGFWRTLLPITTPVGKSKKTRKKLTALIEQTQDLVQALNDQFNHQHQDYRTQFDHFHAGEEF